MMISSGGSIVLQSGGSLRGWFSFAGRLGNERFITFNKLVNLYTNPGVLKNSGCPLFYMGVFVLETGGFEDE